MKIDPNQRTQVIVLCSLVVFVFGFGIYRIVGTTTSASPKAKTEAKVDEKASKQVSEEPAVDTGIVPVVALGESRDPFEPRILPRREQSSTAEPRPVRNYTPPLPSPIAPMPIAIGPVPNAQPQEEPVDKLTLTGVIEGDVDLAIIRGSGGERYIVREGQRINGKYKVLDISRSGVKLKFEDKTIVLHLGGNG
ncbi:MAG: hypothetical protein ACYC2Y_07435 [Armatimonadota bacterium]